ncbi:MAG TPA: 30S ribosomal protein S6 [Firmicutes bacterium]|nr:30S ribosomal protein S6 [Bacillota bacterium]
MRDYEVMFILKPDLEEDATSAIVTKFEDLIKNGGGEIEKTDRWGKRRLAYEIDGFNEGYYVLIDFKAEAGVAGELERVLKITDGVIRFLITRKGE